ncbi:MAG: nucleotide sugar dehydrogenase [Patescibacteria group bacterium]
MKILYIGSGYVGACSAAVSADSGHQVLVYDINHELVKKMSSRDKDIIEGVLFEEGLGELIIRNQERLKFTDSLEKIKEFINQAEAIFLCLPTPEKDETGETDLSYYEKAVRDLAQVLKIRNENSQSQYVLLINKSTVPIEMINRTKEILEQAEVRNFSVGANPEFLVEGKAIEGSIRPQRIVVGASNERDFQIFRNIYQRFCDSPNVEYVEVNPVEAAAGKLVANYFLLNRLANCFDVVGRTCENFNDLNFENVKKILITDKRIGDWGFYNSLYAGGSCLIKDARSLAYQLKEKEVEAELIDNIISANKRQLVTFLRRPEAELDYGWEGKNVGLLGLAFKRHTNDIRNSAAIYITKYLIKNGVKLITAYDPTAGKNFRNYFKDEVEKIKVVKHEDEAIDKMDAIIIITDWPQFRELANMFKNNLAKGSLIMDGRRMLRHKYEELSEAGYNIIAVGSPLIKAKQ